MKRTWLIALLLPLAACGSEPEVAAQPEASSPAPATEPRQGLVEICPEVEAALPGSLGEESERQEFLTFLATTREAGDVEAQNALDLLIERVEEYPNLDIFDARAGYRDGISAFATRCAAAGSSALQ